jgi:hypothetical protein
MTKNEKLRLHSLKCEVETASINLESSRPEKLNLVKFSLTDGELNALTNALTNHNTAVGEDLIAYLRNAAARAGITL